MAHMNITVEGNEYTIEMDVHDWEYIIVNGTKHFVMESALKVTVPAPVTFKAVASKGTVTIDNPAPNFFLMQGDNQCHEAILTYNYGQFKEFWLEGQLMNVGPLGGATPGPFNFSQIHLTGTFSKGS